MKRTRRWALILNHRMEIPIMNGNDVLSPEVMGAGQSRNRGFVLTIENLIGNRHISSLKMTVGARNGDPSLFSAFRIWKLSLCDDANRQFSSFP
jgi:hypothetical protein